MLQHFLAFLFPANLLCLARIYVAVIARHTVHQVRSQKKNKSRNLTEVWRNNSCRFFHCCSFMEEAAVVVRGSFCRQGRPKVQRQVKALQAATDNFPKPCQVSTHVSTKTATPGPEAAHNRNLLAKPWLAAGTPPCCSKLQIWIGFPSGWTANTTASTTPATCALQTPRISPGGTSALVLCGGKTQSNATCLCAACASRQIGCTRSIWVQTSTSLAQCSHCSCATLACRSRKCRHSSALTVLRLIGLLPAAFYQQTKLRFLVWLPKRQSQKAACQLWHGFGKRR